MSRPSSYSCNDNQNYFVADGKTTSRVLQEPGGKSSISLGWTDKGAEKQIGELQLPIILKYGIESFPS